MSSNLFESRWPQAAFLVITLSIFIFSLLNAVGSGFGSIPLIEIRNEAGTVQDITEHIVVTTAVSFGFRHVSDAFSPVQGTDGKDQDHDLKKRAGTLSYSDAWCKGARNLQTLQKGNPNGPVVVVQEDFEDSGWTIADDLPRSIPDDLKGAVETLKISSKEADIHRVEADQFSVFTNRNGDRQDDPSGGSYLQTYIPKSGAIFASQNTSPEQSIVKDRRDNQLPPFTAQQLREFIPELNRWSDVVWFLWAKYAGNDAGNLRYIIRDNVVNDDTKGVIDQIFNSKTNALYQPWPGKTFDIRKPPSEQGKSKTEGDNARALLGTPHGAGIAWMLADHRDKLGDKSLKITVFTSDDMFAPKIAYYMVFELIKP